MFVVYSQFIETEDKCENDLRVKPGKGFVMTTVTINSLRLGMDPKEFSASITRGDTGCLYGQYSHLIELVLVVNEVQEPLTLGNVNLLVLEPIGSVTGAMGVLDLKGRSQRLK
jgi:hypothetical protein